MSIYLDKGSLHLYCWILASDIQYKPRPLRAGDTPVEFPGYRVHLPRGRAERDAKGKKIRWIKVMKLEEIAVWIFINCSLSFWPPISRSQVWGSHNEASRRDPGWTGSSSLCALFVVLGGFLRRSFGRDLKNRGPVSLQVTHDKDPSLFKDP